MIQIIQQWYTYDLKIVILLFDVQAILCTLIVELIMKSIFKFKVSENEFYKLMKRIY